MKLWNNRGLLTGRVGGGFSPERPLLLIHIFKTGGSSLRHQIERNCGVRQTQGVYVDSGARGLLKGYVSERELTNNGASLYYGHMFYGVHEVLGVPATYGTFLREPVARVVSHVHHFNRSELWAQREVRSLADYVSDGDIQFDNLQTRFLSGYRAVPFGELQQVHLERAKETVRNLVFLGLLENLDVSISRLNGLLGTSIELDKKINVGASSRTPLASTDVDLIREHNQLDAELYDFAKQIFDA